MSTGITRSLERHTFGCIMCRNVTCASASHKTAARPPECSFCWCGTEENVKTHVDKHGGSLRCRLDPHPPSSASPAIAQGKPCHIVCLEQQGIGVAFFCRRIPPRHCYPLRHIDFCQVPAQLHQSFRGWGLAAMPVVVSTMHLPRLRPSLGPLEGFATDTIAVPSAQTGDLWCTCRGATNSYQRSGHCLHSHHAAITVL